MESTRVRSQFPVLPRIEDLEQSHEWNGLTCEIKNLERLNNVERSRWRKSASNQLGNSPRGTRTVQRRSMPETVKPDLVYVRMTNSENVRSTREKMNDRGERTRHRDCFTLTDDTETVDPCTWKPRTEFERNYFGVMENAATKSSLGNETSGKIEENYSSPNLEAFTSGLHQAKAKNSISGYYRNVDDIGQDFDLNEKTSGYVDDNWPAETRTSGTSHRYESPRNPAARHNARETGQNTSTIGQSVARHEKSSPSIPAEEDRHEPISKLAYEKYELPIHRYVHENDNAEYRGSRERLHEIFEHNRLLRRQFFANMPGGGNDNHSPDDENSKEKDRQSNRSIENNNSLRDISTDVSTMRNRLDFQKNSGISGFGSTETLTSQSNQSGASSNGRKSRTEFGNSPEPSEDPRIYEKVGPTDTTVGFTIVKQADRTAGHLDLRRTDFTCDFLPLPLKSSIEYRSNSSDDINETDFYNSDHHSQRSLRGIIKESQIDGTAKMASNDSVLQSRHRTDSLDSDRKFFATYVNVDDFAKTGSNVSSTRTIDRMRLRKPKVIPPPLDLTTIERKWDDRWDEERDVLKNYTIEVTPLRDYERSSRGILTVLGDNDSSSGKKSADFSSHKDHSKPLRGSKSLVELSSNPSQSPSSSSKKSRKIGSSKARKKNLDSRFSSTVGDLRSPQLVNDFSNSLNDLVDRLDNDEINSRSLRLPQKIYDEEDLEEPSKNSSPDSVQRQSDISSTSTGNGTTLPLVYGPIPYKSPRRYVEGEVTIHYRSPVRHEAKEILSEEELARRSAENMRRVYQEERRRKYLQELHDIDSRRHTDNFVPSQKSPIPLNRYDDFVDDLSYRSRSQEPTPEPRLVARALYNFVGQSSRELTFRRGDLIFVRRQVDKNWYEGEHNAMIGLFPFNYVEILPYDGTRTTPKKPYEGQARAKFNFVAQTNLELSLAKGELVVITRRVDENWYEGRIGNRKGIFPVSYVEVMAEPGHRSETPVLQSSKPVASPAAHSLLSNGTSGGKMSMGPHHYTPTMPVNTSTTQPHYNSLPRMGGNKLHVAPVNETLHIDTHSETIPYRALYNYRPQNEDELELKEGDTVYVMEKCDDGWYVGSSQRTGYFGTFPGNYVERL